MERLGKPEPRGQHPNPPMLCGSRFVAMDAANEAMVRTMFDFGARCQERARYTDKLLSVPQPASTTIRRTIDDVLGGRGEE